MLIEIKEKKTIKNSKDISQILRTILNSECHIDQDKEHFWVVGFNCRNVIKYIELVSLGTLSSTLTHPREIFRRAIMQAACSIIVAHNHPSEDPTPSNDDIEITKKVKKSGEILGIKLLDSLVITKDNYISLIEKSIVE